MADVFVLGAGFSKAVFEAMPVVSELIDPLADHLDEHGVHPRYGELLRSLRDLEAVLTGWAEPQPWLLEEEQLENRGTFRRTARWLAGELFAKQQWGLGSGPVPGWLSQLVGRWHEDRSAVVTLNYDTLVESAVRSAIAGPHGANTYRSLFGDFPPPLVSQAGFGVYGGELAETFRLLKLHGSLDWWYDRDGRGQPRPYHADSIEGWNTPERKGFEEVVGQAAGLEPLMVPPVTSKGDLLGHPWLRRMWRDAHRALSSAERVLLLGYSMPAADTSMRLLIGSSPAGQLVPINTDRQVIARLEDLFPDREVITDWVSDEMPIPVFAQAYANGP